MQAAPGHMAVGSEPMEESREAAEARAGLEQSFGKEIKGVMEMNQEYRDRIRNRIDQKALALIDDVIREGGNREKILGEIRGLEYAQKAFDELFDHAPDLGDLMKEYRGICHNRCVEDFADCPYQVSENGKFVRCLLE